jgi:hypothetical protein
MRQSGYVTCRGGIRKAYKFLVVKPEHKSPVRRLLRSWERGIKLDTKEVGRKSVDWISMAQDKLKQWVSLPL